MTKTLLVLRGVPASGKSTFATEWVLAEENRIRVNRDDIRLGMFGALRGVDEDAVTRVESDLIAQAMRRGQDIVLDATNLNAKNLRGKLKIAAKWGYEVQHKDFHISREEAKRRDDQREKSVGHGVIDSFFDRYLKRGFPKFPETPPAVHFEPYVPDTSKPRAIIVDMDGTLAIHQGRSPYDNSLIHTDKPDPTVASLVEDQADYGVAIIIMSGRDEGDARDATRFWLMDNGIDYARLIMRPAGDKRNDAIVKNELFEKYVAPNYNVLFALDDRDRVVEMWRAKGIKCLQCEPGAF